MAHEYGHHIHDLYGFWNGGCGTTDHRTLAQQWIADAYGHALAIDASTQFSAGYNVTLDSVSRHFSLADEAAANLSCTQSFRGLVQPVWEIMWDVNCGIPGGGAVNCQSDTAVNSANAFGLATTTLRGVVMQALAFTSNAIPNFGNFIIHDAADFFLIFTDAEFGIGSADAQMARSIFAHHAL